MRKTEIKAVNQLGGVYPTEEAFQKIYDKCLENQPQAPETVMSSYKRMREAFDEYLADTQEDMFRYAYRCGYEAAVAAFGKGGAA